VTTDRLRESSPLSIGFVIARCGVRVPWIDGQTYRGLDRLPHVPNPLEEPGLTVEWGRYLTAWEDGEVSRNLQTAQAMCESLASDSGPFEVIYADVEVGPPTVQPSDPPATGAAKKESLGWLLARSANVPAPPSEFASIGLDISTAAPSFYSAITQPLLSEHRDDIELQLNADGLIDDPEFAEQLMTDANRTGYLLGLFCVLRVFALIAR
jgi:hypothetical protein